MCTKLRTTPGKIRVEWVGCSCRGREGLSHAYVVTVRGPGHAREYFRENVVLGLYETLAARAPVDGLQDLLRAQPLQTPLQAVHNGAQGIRGWRCQLLRYVILAWVCLEVSNMHNYYKKRKIILTGTKNVTSATDVTIVLRRSF